MLVKEKDGKIAELQARILDLEKQLKAHSKYGVSQKVYVEDGGIAHLVSQYGEDGAREKLKEFAAKVMDVT